MRDRRFQNAFARRARFLRPDIIKLDRALIKDCDQNRTLSRIVASLISLGAELGMKVVAEGVERREEVDSLRSVGVRFVQGFYFAKPIFQGVAHDNTILWRSFGPAIP